MTGAANDPETAVVVVPGVYPATVEIDASGRAAHLVVQLRPDVTVTIDASDQPSLREAIACLADRYRQEERRHLDACNKTDRSVRGNEGFWRSCWQRYVDYGRRAADLELILRYH